MLAAFDPPIDVAKNVDALLGETNPFAGDKCVHDETITTRQRDKSDKR
jgi:hypothetical protein